MPYEYEIFISYRRSSTAGKWVQTHLLPRLSARINELAPQEVRLSCNSQLEGGVRWPEELKRRLQTSGLLLCVWTADYFRSPWCMAEWMSFKERETLLGMFTQANPQGLVYPIRYADGQFFHPDAKNTQCRRDFSDLSYPDEVFRLSEKYIAFDDLVTAMANDLVERLSTLPAWQADFPIVEPPPMPEVKLSRPILVSAV